MSVSRPDGADGPGIDPHLRAALDHAPDAGLRPPPAVQQAVLQAAHAGRREPTTAARGWRRAWHALWAPRGLAAVAGVATVGIALKLAWQPEPAWVADDAQAPAPRTAQAPGRSDPVLPPVPAAPAPAEEARSLDATAQAPAETQSANTVAPAAVAIAPNATTTPPPAAPVAEAPSRAFAGAAPQAARAERAAKSAASRDMGDDQARAASSAPAGPGHPAPLARWAQALAVPAAEAGALPAGWQVRRGDVPVVWGAASRAWWQALLAGTEGRWMRDDAVPAGAGVTMPSPPNLLQVQAPDGARFSLRLSADAVWLHAGGAGWQAARPTGLTAPPDSP